MKFTNSLATLLESELKGATVTCVCESSYSSGKCKITLSLSDGRQAKIIADEYWSSAILLKKEEDGE